MKFNKVVVCSILSFHFFTLQAGAVSLGIAPALREFSEASKVAAVAKLAPSLEKSTLGQRVLHYASMETPSAELLKAEKQLLRGEIERAAVTSTDVHVRDARNWGMDRWGSLQDALSGLAHLSGTNRTPDSIWRELLGKPWLIKNGVKNSRVEVYKKLAQGVDPADYPAFAAKIDTIEKYLIMKATPTLDDAVKSARAARQVVGTEMKEATEALKTAQNALAGMNERLVQARASSVKSKPVTTAVEGERTAPSAKSGSAKK